MKKQFFPLNGTQLPYRQVAPFLQAGLQQKKPLLPFSHFPFFLYGLPVRFSTPAGSAFILNYF